ncbi:MAG TPA: AAA family ATPase [Crenotrichaceae bacterium]|nr:AAA family ATPase [Crenotrichaceae bacterium]
MQPIFRTDAKQPPSIDLFKPLPTGEGVIDEATFRIIEVDALFDVVNQCQTTAGKVSLYRSLTNPGKQREKIQAVQESLQELDNNPQLEQSLKQLVAETAVSEPFLYQLLYGTFLGMFGASDKSEEIEGYGYEQYRKGTQCVVNLTEGLQAIQKPHSDYLSGLIKQIEHFSQSRLYSLIKGPAYITESGVKTQQEKKPWIPALRFRPTLFKPIFIGIMIGLFFLLNLFPILEWMRIPGIVRNMAMIVGAPLLLAYIPVVGTFDRDSCIYKLRDEFRQSEDVQQMFEVLGQLDQLLSFKSYADQFGSEMVFPRLIDSNQHAIQVEQAKNPILAYNNPGYVGNHINLTDNRLLFITGPNSGGKTAFCKTIAQIQLLAQLGCKVPAQHAELVVADFIFYQAPEFSSLSDGEGRFGAELKRTREIFMMSTERSLVILDELSEGTTYEERMETSINVLDGFFRKKVTTLLITHNHQLVDHFINRQIGQAWQVEFADDGVDHSGPTYHLIPGISRISHADKIAKKIGFSKQDIDDHLGISI